MPEVRVRHSIEVVDDKKDEYKVSTSPSGEQVQLEFKIGGKELSLDIPTEVWMELIYFNPEDGEADEEEG